MKLSTAIRKGIERDGKQVFGTYFAYDSDGAVTGCCALGAAMIGLEPKAEPHRPRRSYMLLPQFTKAHARNIEKCPVRGCKSADHDLYFPGPAIDTVPHLNDFHRWKRERIADWLEGIGL